MLPLALDLCLSGLEVHLLSSQVIRLLLKVVRMAMGTLVWWCDFEHLLNRILTVDVVAHVRWGIAVDVVGVIL